MTTERLVFTVPEHLEDDLVAALWELGTSGVEVLPGESGRVRVEAYFEGPVAPEAEKVAGVSDAVLVGREDVPTEDWLASYRELAQPVRIGKRLVVDPREPGEEVISEDARITLRIPARGAFGTGSHESTRLVLELLEGMDLSGRRVLDVGCGTGILSLAALAFGARSAIAFDVDPAAPFHARSNARLNADPVRGAGPLLFAGDLACLGPVRLERRFDLALVNVIPEHVLPEIDTLGSVLQPGATALFSGILTEAGERVAAELAAAGFRRVGVREAGEWVAFHTTFQEVPGPLEGSP